MRIVSLAPFRIAKPDSGGRRLIFDGARQWAATCDAFRCLALTTLRDRGRPAAPFPYREYRAFSSLGLALVRSGLLPKAPYLRSLRRYAPRLAREAMREKPDLVEVHFPWLAAVRRHLPDTVRVVLVMHNVESIWHEFDLGRHPLARPFGRMIFRLEAEALAEADHVVCLTRRDRQELIFRHALRPQRVSVIPPGFDPPDPRGVPARGGSRRILFVSSGFQDGVMSAERLMDQVVPRLDPGLELVIAGAVCRKLKGRRIPPAVRLAGFVPDLQGLIRGCRAMVNPDRSQTGINMKVLGALQAGIPVISTPEGARGYEDLAGGPVRVGNLSDFPEMIRSAGPLSSADREALRRYEWPGVGARRMALYGALLSQAGPGPEPSARR